MVLPLVVIDVHEEAAKNPDYTLSIERVKNGKKIIAEFPPAPSRRCALTGRSVGHMRLAALIIAVVLAANAFGQQKPESAPGDTGSDLLWKKLETRVRDVAERFDGVMAVAFST